MKTLFILLILYFIPALTAFGREHHSRWAIFTLNLLTGWTFLGWVVAIVWAMTAVQSAPVQQGATQVPQTDQ